MKIKNIQWDLSDLSKEEQETISLPTEVDVEKDLGIDISLYDLSKLEEEISDTLSVVYGYCHCGFRYTPPNSFRITVVDKATYDIIADSAEEAEEKAIEWFQEREPSVKVSVLE